MDKIITTFKNLYIEDNQDFIKRHLWLCFLFLYPAISMVAFSLYNNEYCQMVSNVYYAIGIIFAVLSVIPFLMISGFYVKFLNLRFKKHTGIPKIDIDCLKKGLKVLPLQIVWTLYILILAFIALALVIAFSSLFIPHNEGALLFVLIIPILWGFISSILALVLVPFTSMIFINFSEKFSYNKGLFNPLLLVTYIKELFKEGILIALKYYVANLVISTVVQLIMGIGILIFTGYGMCVLGLNELYPNVTLVTILLVLLLLAVSVLVAFSVYYTYQIVYLAMSDNYVEVYKTKILRQYEEDDYEA